MAPLIDETCLSSSSNNYSMDIDNMSVTSSYSHSEDVEQVILMDTCKASSAAVPQHVPTARRYVHFSDDHNTVHLVLSRADYTMEERSASWYDRSSLKEMRATSRSEARLLEAGLLHETSTTSVRGLESRTTEGLRRKRRNRADAVNAVFDELDHQDEQGIFDDDALADVYFVHTEHCQATAQMMGMRDAKLAQEEETQGFVKSDLFCSVPLLPKSIMNSLSTPERLVISSAA
jgi:hypothetical protein